MLEVIAEQTLEVIDEHTLVEAGAVQSLLEVIAEQTLDPLDPLELVCRGCRRKAILNARSAECALLLELEEDTAHMPADF